MIQLNRIWLISVQHKLGNYSSDFELDYALLTAIATLGFEGLHQVDAVLWIYSLFLSRSGQSGEGSVISAEGHYVGVWEY